MGYFLFSYIIFILFCFLLFLFLSVVFFLIFLPLYLYMFLVPGMSERVADLFVPGLLAHVVLLVSKSLYTH